MPRGVEICCMAHHVANFVMQPTKNKKELRHCNMIVQMTGAPLAQDATDDSEIDRHNNWRQGSSKKCDLKYSLSRKSDSSEAITMRNRLGGEAG